MQDLWKVYIVEENNLSSILYWNPGYFRHLSFVYLNLFKIIHARKEALAEMSVNDSELIFDNKIFGD